jgi:hypothetical protein
VGRGNNNNNNNNNNNTGNYDNVESALVLAMVVLVVSRELCCTLINMSLDLI